MTQETKTSDKIRRKNALEFNKFLSELVNGIDVKENTEWENETRTVSENVREALVSYMNKELKGRCDSLFLNFCNCIKSMLAVYNFGNLDTEEGLVAAGCDMNDTAVEACRKRLESDKQMIKDGIKSIIRHVEDFGFDITPYIDVKSELDSSVSDDESVVVPITLSATTVMTTLVYFRRAVKRIGLYDKMELIDNGEDLMEKVADTVAAIMIMFAEYIANNRYEGWGFTLDKSRTTAVTLNDTYAVIDAISRFEDAFNKKEEDKRDSEFMDLITKYAEAHKFHSLIKYCGDAMYRTSLNVYNRYRGVYGRSIFYTEAIKNSKSSVDYSFAPITYEQISSSNRSSALFNPLYVAMITMYGYADKEIVIRRFMDDPALALQYYNKYEKRLNDDGGSDSDGDDDSNRMTISEYCKKELDWYKSDFENDVAMLTDLSRSTMAYNYQFDTWSRYYDISRVFQKYLETQCPDELMKIEEYRDYLNATKDAIDQVQIAYRKFGDSQRLGIVDTDYVMFSALDLKAEAVSISKLNKANIAVNSLRPMLLSSKIMIVNALTKYPQSDMADLYNAIKSSKHRKTLSKKRGGGKVDEWLWNEDTVDMNSTARHCEAIAYDYFDYYERYELGLKAITGLKENVGKLVKDHIGEDGTLDFDNMLASDGMDDFRRVVLDVTRKNVELINTVYTKKLRDKDNEIVRLNEEIEKNKQKADEEKRALVLQMQEQLKAAEISIEIGEAVRGWVRAEADRHLKKLLSMMIINNVNHYPDKDRISLSMMMSGKKMDELVDANFDSVKELSQSIMTEYQMNERSAKEKYEPQFRNARNLQELLEGALDDILKNESIRSIVDGDKDLSVRNDQVRELYDSYKIAIRNGELETTHKTTDGGENK